MREPYDQGLASQVDPESCGGGREATLEALTGAGAGRVLNRDIVQVRGVDAHMGVRKATPADPDNARDGGPRAVRDPVHASKHLTREALPPLREALPVLPAPPPDRKPGDLPLGHGQDTPLVSSGPRRESFEEQDGDERA